MLQSINGPKEGHKKGSSPATTAFMYSSSLSIAEDFSQNLLMSQTGFETKIWALTALSSLSVLHNRTGLCNPRGVGWRKHRVGFP